MKRPTWREVKEDFSWLPVKINTVTSPKAEAENVCQGKMSIWQNSPSHATVNENCCASSCKGNTAIHTFGQPFSIQTSRRQMLREVPPARLLCLLFFFLFVVFLPVFSLPVSNRTMESTQERGAPRRERTWWTPNINPETIQRRWHKRSISKVRTHQQESIAAKVTSMLGTVPRQMQKKMVLAKSQWLDVAGRVAGARKGEGLVPRQLIAFSSPCNYTTCVHW